MTISANSFSVLILLPWSILWLAGGLWLSRAAFRLPSNEEVVVGIALGWIGQNWLANLLAQVLPVPAAFWTAAGLVFLGGSMATLLRQGWQGLFTWKVPLAQLLVLAGTVLISFSIAHGTAIFDDFAHLPTVSVMAAGDIPPHFVLDPKVVYGYHHFLLLFSAQLMRIGSLMPWLAVDAGRAVSFGLAVLLGGIFSHRLTRSLVGGLFGGLLVAFGSGARWLLLLLPTSLVAWLSRNVHLIGSGAGSGATLPAAMVSSWAVEGAGPVPFPFAFANGIYPPGVIQMHNANGLASLVVIFLLLLTFNRWRSGLAAVLSAVVISVWGLLGEAELPAIAAGWVVVGLACLVINRKRPFLRRLPRALWAWLGVVASGAFIGLVEGGAWTDLLLKQMEKLSGKVETVSYQTVGFQFAWPPAIVSSHLGVLPVFDPGSLIVALLELGPLLLVFPLLVAWGFKAFRAERWYEAATAATAVGMLLAFFVQFSGSTGVRNTPRLYTFMPLLAAFAAPLAWIWAGRRSSAIKAMAAGIEMITITGGLVMFGVELIAIQRPVYSYYLTVLDARMTRNFWNRLEPGAFVFDPVPSRATTVLGRPTDSNITWYQTKPEWEALRNTPDPYRLRAAGFSYFYLDNSYWDGLPSELHKAFTGGCVRLIGEESDNQGNFRRLLDLRDCR